MVIIAWNLYQVFKKESNLLLQITSLGTAAITMFATVNRWIQQKSAATIVEFLNAMVDFQASSKKRGNINNTLLCLRSSIKFKITSFPCTCSFRPSLPIADPRNLSVLLLIFLMKSVEVAIYMLIAAFPIIALFTPRIPPFVGYFVCRVANDWLGDDLCGIEDATFHIAGIRGNITLNVVRVVGAFITFFTFATVLWSALLVVMYEVFPSVLFQTRCLRLLRLESGRSVFANYKQVILKYRQLQVLNVMFNNIYSRDVFEICMATALLIIIPSGYSVITMHSTSPWAFIAITYIALTEYASITVMFGMAGRVWGESVEFNWAWKKNHQLAGKPISRKYAKSLKHIKVKIGATNFFEKNTPLVFLSFCIQQTVNLVLMQK
jgi:hypothetical protein